MYIFHFLLVFDILQWTSLKPILVSKVPRIHNFKVNVVSFYVWFSTHTLEFWSRIPILLHSLDFVRMFICFIHEIGSNRLFVRTTVKRIHTKKKKKGRIFESQRYFYERSFSDYFVEEPSIWVSVCVLRVDIEKFGYRSTKVKKIYRYWIIGYDDHFLALF